MNKYQEALDRILNDDYDFPHDFYGEDKATQIDCDIDTLQELVDKATPKKVIKLKKEQYGYTHQCPVCEQLVGTIVMSRNNEFSPYIEENDYCCSCGQALDWSE